MMQRIGKYTPFSSSHYALLLSRTGNSQNHAHKSHKAKHTPRLTKDLGIEKPPKAPTSSTFKTTPIPARTLARTLESPRESVSSPSPLAGVKSTRRTYTAFQKYCHLLEFQELQIENPNGISKKLYAEAANIPEATFNTWTKTTKEITSAALTPSTKKRKRKNQKGAQVKQPGCENAVFQQILARNIRGAIVTCWWIKRAMEKLVRAKFPEATIPYTATPDWLRGFKRRYNLSWRAVTSKKQKDLNKALEVSGRQQTKQALLSNSHTLFPAMCDVPLTHYSGPRFCNA
jgi:hypothetical protein